MGNGKKAALHNLGCKVNSYETEAMRQLLEDAGYEIVPFTERADVYVVNTCSVTNIADRKSRQMLHRARKQNPEAVIVAAGCYVQTKREAADPAVDLLIGNNQKGKLPGLLEEYFAGRETKEAQPVCAVMELDGGGVPFEELAIPRPTQSTRAFLKVQDGCSRFCSYCIIPYARGRVRSRSTESVLREVERLAENGCREVVLTGIHLSSYGEDTGESLLGLLRAVHGVEKIARIRLGSLEPTIITEELVSELVKLPKLCPHFHLSLQSGCDATLMRMNRRYTTAEYEKSCGLLRSAFGHPALTTDVIVGFPGETEEEFFETGEFLRRIHFYEMHIFKYSRRQGTQAALMEDQIPEEVKTERSGRLLALAEQMSAEFREYYRGRETSVLFEERQRLGGRLMYVGYTPEYVRAASAADTSLTNRLVRGTLGEVIDAPQPVLRFTREPGEADVI